jgi:hypothetical protein
MKKLTVVLIFPLPTLDPVSVPAQSPKYRPLSEYMMTTEAEIALARSAAPENVSAYATVKVLSSSGYKVAVHGDNGFVCMVCGAGARSYLHVPAHPAHDRLGLQGESTGLFRPCGEPDRSSLLRTTREVGDGGQGCECDSQRGGMAYALGELPKREGVAFAYMWSADMNLGPGAGAWHPHMMIYAPDYDNSLLGETSPEDRRPWLARTPERRLP